MYISPFWRSVTIFFEVIWAAKRMAWSKVFTFFCLSVWCKNMRKYIIMDFLFGQIKTAREPEGSLATRLQPDSQWATARNIQRFRRMLPPWRLNARNGRFSTYYQYNILVKRWFYISWRAWEKTCLYLSKYSVRRLRRYCIINLGWSRK